MATQESTSLPRDVQVTTVEALLRQLQTDAERLAELAQNANDSYSEGFSTTAILDTIDTANLVAASSKALQEVWRRPAAEVDEGRAPMEVARDALRDAASQESSAELQRVLLRLVDELPARPGRRD